METISLFRRRRGVIPPAPTASWDKFYCYAFLDRFSLRLKVLDHSVTQDVGSADASSGGLIVLYYVTRGEELLLGVFSQDKGWCWDRFPGSCVWRGVQAPAPGIGRLSMTCFMVYLSKPTISSMVVIPSFTNFTTVLYGISICAAF